LVVETHDKEIQTTGVHLEELENDLKITSEENSRLSSELDAANKNVEQLKSELENKTNELKSTSDQVLNSNLKVKELSGTMDDLKKIILAKDEKINALYDQRNAFKYELRDKIKEADKISEELIVEKER
jgi:chromosome segregation ATPase